MADPSAGLSESGVKICPACAAESPANFTSCWRCRADLSAVTPTAARPNLKPDLQAAERLTPLTFVKRRTLVLEVIVVQLVAWGWAIPWRIVAEFGSRETAQAGVAETNMWFVSTILLDVALAVLILYLLWRTTGSHEAAGLAGLSWWREVVWGAAIVATGAILVPVVNGVADAIHLPRWTSDMPQAASTTPLTALIFLTGALAEESIFRAYLLSRLEQVFRRRGWAVLVSAILFSVYHLPSPARALELFVVGVLVGVAFYAGRKLPRLVLAHWAWNLMMVY